VWTHAAANEDPVTDATGHLPYWTLEQLAEDDLPQAERVLAERHLRGCARCTGDLHSARAVIAALEALPTFEPSPAFADAVMARVSIAPQAAPDAAAEPARGWLPHTRRGWTLLGALVMLPALPLIAFGFWLFSHPGVSAGTLWEIGSGWMQNVAWAMAVDAAGAVLRSPALDWLAAVGELTPSATVGGVPVVVLVAAVAIPASALMMIRLLRTPMGGMTHAH
jgi:hypothetical protein